MQESVTPSMEFVERGVFVIATCRVCGWHSPARRAFSTAHREAAEHSAVCASAHSHPQVGERTGH